MIEADGQFYTGMTSDLMRKNIGESTVTVPVRDHKELKPGTLRAIIRQSGLTVQDFIREL